MVICPTCGAALTRQDAALRCLNGHTFDVAREGYVNLLAGGRRSAATVGDSKQMLTARRAFLDHGHYAPLADALWRTVAAHRARIASPDAADEARRACIVEVGCGEGYYIASVQREIARSDGQAPLYVGVDVAKDAARMAAKRYHDVQFLVADINHALPFADGTVDVLLNVFAPRHAAEFARIVAPGGLLLVVIPGPRHLAEARQDLNLLGMEQHKEQRVREQFADAYTLVTRTSLEYTLHLSQRDAADLVAMSPTHRHVGKGRGWGDAPNRRDKLDTTVSFVALAFERRQA